MSASTIVYAAGILLLYLARRFAAFEELQWTLTVLGVLVAYVGAISLRLVGFRKAEDAGVRLGHRVAFACLLISFIGVLVYGMTTDEVVRSMSFSDEGEERWLGMWGSIWPLVWLIGTIPLLFVDYGLQSSPVVMPPRRVVALATHGLVVALGLALVFPVNYVASKTNERWDLSYFKTATPGTATQAVVESLERPVHVRIFMPPSSEVALELRNYFQEIEGPKLEVEVIDQAAHPKLAQSLAVRQNGVVTFTVGDVELEPSKPEPEPEDGAAEAAKDEPKTVTRTLRVPTEIDKATRTLRKLDSEVQQLLIELAHGERIAYVTTGHGELSTQAKGILNRSMVGYKDVLEKLGFRVKPLGLRQDLGQRVPDDADLVVVLGPLRPFQQAEADSLRRYLDSGGPMLVALEPEFIRRQVPGHGPDPLLDLLAERAGLKLGEGTLAGEQAVYPLTRDLQDRLNIVTASFSSHPSNRTVAEHSNEDYLIAPLSGHLEQTENPPTETKFTTRSLAVHWADLDYDFEYDPDDGESKDARNLIAAVTGGNEGAPWRLLVTSGSTMFSDLVMGNRGNERLAEDMVKWLVGVEGLSGTTESEEDVKIEHTKEGQATWFYLTVLGMPLLVMVLGAIRIRLRRRGALRRGRAAASKEGEA